MADAIKTPNQQDYGWYKTLSASGQYPLIANRIWETLKDADEYISPADTFACAGLLMRVVKDTTDNNGIYLVEYDTSDTAHPSKLKLTAVKSGGIYSGIWWEGEQPDSSINWDAE